MRSAAVPGMLPIPQMPEEGNLRAIEEAAYASRQTRGDADTDNRDAEQPELWVRISEDAYVEHDDGYLYSNQHSGVSKDDDP